MKPFLARLFLTSVSLYLISLLFDSIELHSFFSAIFAAVIFAVINITIRPLLHFFSLPLTCLTLGLFAFVVNALCFGLVAFLVPGFEVHGFWAALFGFIFFSLLNTVLHYLTNTSK